MQKWINEYSTIFYQNDWDFNVDQFRHKTTSIYYNLGGSDTEIGNPTTHDPGPPDSAEISDKQTKNPKNRNFDRNKLPFSIFSICTWTWSF